MKAAGGRNKSPPCRRNVSESGEATLDKNDITVAASNGGHAVEMAVAKFVPLNDIHSSHYGKNRKNRIVSQTQAEISSVSLLDDHVPLSMLGGVMVSNSNVDSNNGPKTDNKELGQAETQPDRTKRTWTRINRMEVGLSTGTLTTNITKLGKRQKDEVLEENCEAGIMTLH